MKNKTPLLIGILVAQLLLVGLVSLGGDGGAVDDDFLKIDPALVRGFSITDGEGQRVDLSLSGEEWQLESGLRADAEKISGVLNKLAVLQAAWPVATSTSTQVRFEVTEDAYQRHLILTDGDTPLAEIYLGTSPGYRRVHARLADEDAVYSVDFANHEVPTRLDDWLDKDLFQTEEIRSLGVAGGVTGVWQLTRESVDSSWLLDGGAADTEVAQQLIDRVQRLRVLGFSEAGHSELGEAQVVSIADAAGAHELTFRHDAENDEYLLTSDRISGQFVVASYIAEQILLTADRLLPEPEAEPEPEPEPEEPAGI
jgi:hypothetical protein